MKLPLDGPVAIGRPFIDLKPEIATAIMRTVEAGWAYALKSPGLGIKANEVAITEKIRDGMRCALNSGILSWGGAMMVPPGTESRSRPDVPAPDGRTDIPIYWIEIFICDKDHDPHAIIECKRVAGNNTRLCREYVKEGMDRFRTGKYSGNHSTGFMIGYLIAGDASTAARGVNRHLNRKSRSEENLKSSGIIQEQWAWESSHPRMQPACPIKLHHAFLSFEIV